MINDEGKQSTLKGTGMVGGRLIESSDDEIYLLDSVYLLDVSSCAFFPFPHQMPTLLLPPCLLVLKIPPRVNTSINDCGTVSCFNAHTCLRPVCAVFLFLLSPPKMTLLNYYYPQLNPPPLPLPQKKPSPHYLSMIQLQVGL